MSVRLCKYECGTPISWDTKQSKFIEPENGDRIHDRVRCESLRPTANFDKTINAAITDAEQHRRQPHLQQTQMAGNNWQIPREDWQKVLELLTNISENVSVVSESVKLMFHHYDGLVEQQRQLTRLLTRPLDEKAAEAEARYDQDKEEGFA